jgi:hypothetical protein
MAINPESLKNLKPGNKRGPAKTTKLLKDAIIQAATEAGGEDGMVGYLRLQAVENPGPFLSLLGKVLPMQVEGAGENGEHVHEVRWVIAARPADNNT